MAETKNRLFALGRGHNGFYCPETRFHLIGVIKPQDIYPTGLELSTDVKRALVSGTIIDVNGVVSDDELNFKLDYNTPLTSEDRKREQIRIKEEKAAAAEPIVEGNESVAETREFGAVLSEQDISELSKAQLLKFIESNLLDSQALGLKSSSNAGEVKEALLVYFGYKEAQAVDAE